MSRTLQVTSIFMKKNQEAVKTLFSHEKLTKYAGSKMSKHDVYWTIASELRRRNYSIMFSHFSYLLYLSPLFILSSSYHLELLLFLSVLLTSKSRYHVPLLLELTSIENSSKCLLSCRRVLNGPIKRIHRSRRQGGP